MDDDKSPHKTTWKAVSNNSFQTTPAYPGPTEHVGRPVLTITIKNGEPADEITIKTFVIMLVKFF